MSKLIIPKKPLKNTTINRTIRFEGDIFDALEELSQTSGMTFNRLVNTCLRYAIENIEREEEAITK